MQEKDRGAKECLCEQKRTKLAELLETKRQKNNKASLERHIMSARLNQWDQEVKKL